MHVLPPPEQLAASRFELAEQGREEIQRRPGNHPVDSGDWFPDALEARERHRGSLRRMDARI
jgi:hypothetical protein